MEKGRSSFAQTKNGYIFEIKLQVRIAFKPNLHFIGKLKRLTKKNVNAVIISDENGKIININKGCIGFFGMTI